MEVSGEEMYGGTFDRSLLRGNRLYTKDYKSRKTQADENKSNRKGKKKLQIPSTLEQVLVYVGLRKDHRESIWEKLSKLRCLLADGGWSLRDGTVAETGTSMAMDTVEAARGLWEIRTKGGLRLGRVWL